MIIDSNKTNNLLQKVDKAIVELYKNDQYLIANKVHERSIVFRFGVYFQTILNATDFSKLSLDIDYNKNHADPKRTTNFPRGLYPDVILHKRGSNDRNILMIEFKTWWGRNIKKDIQKLKDFTNQYGNYRYQIGLSIMLNRKIEDVNRILISNGECIDE